jgi:NADPH-dependent F420 reductase
MSNTLPTIAIIGGTGDLGTGLARRWLQAGYKVLIGSRTVDKAETAVADLRKVLAERGAMNIIVAALDNVSAAQQADIVVMTVPFGHHAGTLESVKAAVQGKIFSDVTVPLVPSSRGRLRFLGRRAAKSAKLSATMSRIRA